MTNKTVKKFLCLILAFLLAILATGCSFNSYSAEELKASYKTFFENSFNEELYYWKETVNASDYSSWRTCNVYAQIDKKYELIRDENGELANMKISLTEEYNKKNTYKAMCGKSFSSNTGETKSYLFENDFDKQGKEINYRKTEITPQEYVASDDFISRFSLETMLRELEYLTVDDMVFNIDNALLQHRGKTIKFSFAVTDDYIERFKTEFGKSSMFEGSKYATMEFAYDRFASIVVYAEEKLGSGISADKEIYKLEVVYYGPIVNLPSYDSAPWADAELIK